MFLLIGKQDEKLKLEEKIILVQSESIENLLKSEQILEIIEEQNKILKIEMSESREELAYEREKQRSMEDKGRDDNILSLFVRIKKNLEICQKQCQKI